MTEGQQEGFTEKELGEIHAGGGVYKGDKFYAFNIARGRIDEAENFEQKLKQKVEKEEKIRLQNSRAIKPEIKHPTGQRR